MIFCLHCYAMLAMLVLTMKTKTKTKVGDTSRVRRYVREHYVKAAKQSASRSFSVLVGDVHRALGLRNRVPLVCNALSSRKFLEENSLRLVKRTGPPSGQSTTVALTYEMIGEPETGGLEALYELRGIGKETFAALGGGENFLRSERAAFERAMDERERNR